MVVLIFVCGGNHTTICVIIIDHINECLFAVNFVASLVVFLNL